MTNPAPVTKVDVPADQFEAAVVDESRRRPVVVDFWAPWCGPCRTLGPVLERLAGEAGGAWLLAKVNVDEAQELAGRFGVQGIPAVKAFKGGEVVDEFVGALPERQVRTWLEGLVPGPADEAFAEAQAALQGGDEARGREALARVLSARPGHGAALLALAELELGSGRTAEALALADRIPPAEAEKLAGPITGLRMRARAPAGDAAALRRKVEADPADPQARLALGRALAAAGDYPQALDQFLELVQRFHRAEPGDEARRAMLELFEVVGARSELADAYRTKLSRALFR
jgi:putative thioredoxin